MIFDKLDICYVLSHAPDNRYQKRFDALASQFSQKVVFWDKTGLGDFDTSNRAIEPISIEADQTDPLKRLPETLKFIHRAFRKVNELAPRLLYVGNLDMLYIAHLYKKRCPDVKIVYEVADLHRLLVGGQPGIKSLIRRVLGASERSFIRDIDLLVVTSMKFYDVYYSRFLEAEKVVFLPNMPLMHAFDSYDPCRKTKDFTIGFFGWIRYLDQLNLLLDAAEEADVRVIFAGADNSKSSFRERCEQSPQASYLGAFNYERDIAHLYERVDCVYCVYDSDLFNVRVALPNKLYEAVICEKPIIVAEGTYLSELVLKWGVGCAVECRDKQALVKTLKRLKGDSAAYAGLVANCRKHKNDVNPSEYDARFVKNIARLLDGRG